MMKPAVLVALGVLGLASPALAGNPPPKKATPQVKKLNCGESYVVGTHHDEASKVSPRELQVAAVVKSNLGEVQACWSQLPAQFRKVATPAVLKLSVDDTGEVQTVEVAGKVPDEAQRCIALAVARWEFPATAVTSDASHFEYPVTFRAM